MDNIPAFAKVILESSEPATTEEIRALHSWTTRLPEDDQCKLLQDQRMRSWLSKNASLVSQFVGLNENRIRLADLNEAARWAISCAYKAVQAAYNVELMDWQLQHPGVTASGGPSEQFDQEAYRTEKYKAARCLPESFFRAPCLIAWKTAMKEQFGDFT